MCTKVVAPTLPGFQYLKTCFQFLATNTCNPILYSSNDYEGSDVPTRDHWHVQRDTPVTGPSRSENGHSVRSGETYV